MGETFVSALDSNVLVLNRNYMAVHVITARRAFGLLYKDLAEVIHYPDDEEMLAYDFDSWVELSRMRNRFPADETTEFVKTVSVDIRVPRIIRLLFYDRLPIRPIKFNRRNIYARDENRCQYCGKKFPTTELSLDHVVPRHRGGGATWENIVCACTECNARKGGRLPTEAGMKLVRKPIKPKRPPLLRLSIRTDKYRSWRHFVNEAYWSVELK
jgi:5-methylcytosine-specific restriction endonuclease McrA